MFNEYGAFAAGFDFTNLVTFPNNSYVRVKVGRLDPQAFSIDVENIQWHQGFTQV